MTSNPNSTRGHTDLEATINDLKTNFAKPLQEEVITTPLWDVVSRIMSLPDSLSDLDPSQISVIQANVTECKRLLDQISYYYVSQIISKPTDSRVFKIVNQAGKFEALLRRSTGKKITLPDGTDATITPEVVNALTSYKFSLGTPPITPKGIDTIEKIMFGGNLKDIYGFRQLLNVDHATFDRFIRATDILVRQSTHYTTDKEKKSHEKKATDFPNMEGARGFKKTAVTGSAKTAVRLIKDHLFSQHTNGSKPVVVIDEPDMLNADLIKRMTEEKNKVFVVKVSKIPHNIFTSDVLRPEWKGVIGRLILVDDSPNSRRSGTTFVYALNPTITKTLNQFHTKDMGTPANTQMNFREMMENFSRGDLEKLRSSVDQKIADLKSEGSHNKKADSIRKREWEVSAQKDYINLIKFKKFLDFIYEIKTADEADLDDRYKGLQGESEKLSMKYFFKDLAEKGYTTVSIPQGGGRRELAHVGKFQRSIIQNEINLFKSTKLEACKQKLAELKSSGKIPAESTGSIDAALTRALDDRNPQNHILRTQDELSNGVGKVRSLIDDLAYRGAERADTRVDELIGKMDEILGKNVPGFFKDALTQELKKGGIEAASKLFERVPFRGYANKFREVLGRIRQKGVGIADKVSAPLESIRKELSADSLERIEILLNNIEQGKFEPNLALPEIGWTFNDVLLEDDFPAENYIKINVNKDGTIDADSLEQKLEVIKSDLSDFPDLFDLYCKSTILVLNDPHNPTSKVARPAVKLKLLDIASKYGLTILADEPYHKQVAKEVKDRHGDAPLAEFYEQNRARFPKPITIYSCISTTKWAMGAGRRTGTVLTNDKSKNPDGESFAEYLDANTDSRNGMSLYMDNLTYELGLSAKSVCKKLEPILINPIADPKKIIDEILENDFDLDDPENLPMPVYFALLQARNDLDLLEIRGANLLEVREYLSNLISEIKNMRLDKQTQKDSGKRSKAAINAVTKVAEDHPGLLERSTMPEGPFYMLIQLDETGNDPALGAFIETLAAARKIDVVPSAKGNVRFAFGGMVQGNENSYNLLSKAIEVDLKLILKYWDEFKAERKKLNGEKDLNPVENALKKMFPGGEIELARTIFDKKELIDGMAQFKGAGAKGLVFDLDPEIAKYITKIEAGSPGSIVTIKNVSCKNINQFIASKPFTELFNYYLLKVKASVPTIQNLEDEVILGEFGALRFRDKFATRTFKNIETEVYSAIAIEIAKAWYSDSTVKILSQDINGNSDECESILLGKEQQVDRYIREFLSAFLTAEQEAQINFKPTFQAGYEALSGLKPDESLPGWTQKLISSADFVGKTVATDLAPESVTGGIARVAGNDRGIYKRDGDGVTAASPEFFKKRLDGFVENMDPKEWVCKMVQIGPTKLLLVLNRSYSHYLVEELRLFPQFDVDINEIDSIKPDAVSILGLPTKVMGEDYKIGYYFDGEMPVSWVDSEDITDYMGYLKKPLLTVANERVKAMGGMPVHGSAMTLTYKNGLRKTFVCAGDSGTGKSETLIAMMEQMVKGEGLAKDLESIDLLAGDMLSMFIGEDGQVYTFGTEEGDFMRMNDIPDNWQDRFRDRLNRASKTNLGTDNARQTIGGLCDSNTFLKPVRVNGFFNINNFTPVEGSAMKEIASPHNLLKDEYVKGYRREKKTSGDQPNLYASVMSSKDERKDELIDRYREEMDALLNWDVIVDQKSGKVVNGILAFRESSNDVNRAILIAKDLFKGKKIEFNGESRTIESVDYKPLKNRFEVTLSGSPESLHVELDRKIFDQIYNPIASTFCGNPFIHPEGMDKVLSRFAEAMTNSGVITGTIYTQLGVKGQEFSGPAQASQALLDFVSKDPRINERFQANKAKVYKALTEKYGIEAFGQADLPERLQAHNLLLMERKESDSIRLIDAKGETINVETPHYKYDSEKQSEAFNPSMLVPEIENEIRSICESDKYANNLEGFTYDKSDFNGIKQWDSKEELIYQILLKTGVIQLGYAPNQLQKVPAEVRKAAKIAEDMMAA